MRHYRIVWILTILPLSFALGRSRPESAPAADLLIRSGLTGVRGGNLVCSITTDISSFNRLLTAGLGESLVVDRTAADLVHINRRTLEVEPSLASHWELGKDQRTYTLRLRRGLKFSDGSPFTADDVLFTFRVLQDPNVAAAQAGQLQIDGKFPAVRKIDDSTLELAFHRPVGMGLRVLDSIPMLPRTILEKAYREGALGTAWGPSVNPKQVVGMGPFRLREYQRGIKVVLERNPYYWKQDGSGQILPYLDTITFLIVPDRNAQALRFQSGEIDLVESLNAESYAGLRRYRSQGGFTLQDLGAGLGMDFLWFNLNPGLKASGEPIVEREKQALFENDAFRRAISCALDREGMARSVLLGLGEPQYGPVSSGNQAWFSSQVIRPCKGLQQSRSLLAQIGLKDANGDGLLEYGSRNRPLELALITSRGNAAREKVAQIISENLRNIGISVHVQTLLPGEIAARFMNSMDYEAILFGFTPTDVVPDLQADLWYSSGKLHFWHPGQSKPYRPWEARMDELTSRLLQAPDPAERRKIFFEIQEIWALQMPAIPTVAPNVLSGWHNHMGNIRPSILVPNLLWNAEEITKRPPQQR